MQKLILLLLALALSACGSGAQAAIYAVSPNGAAVPAQLSLSAAAAAPSLAGTIVHVSSVLSAVQSNISSATVHSWPRDRALVVDPGGSINPTTKFVGLPAATPEMFGGSLQLAIKAAQQVFLSGNKVYTASSVSTIPAPINILGAGPGSVLQNYGLSLNSTGGYYGKLDSFLVNGTNASNSVGLKFYDTHKMTVSNVQVNNFTTGALFTYAWSNNIYNSSFNSNTTGARIINNGNGISAYGTNFDNNAANGLELLSSQKLTFSGCDFSNNGGYGVYIDSSDNGTFQMTTAKFDSSYMEGNVAGDFYVGAGTNGIKVAGVVFTDNSHFGTKPNAYVVDNAADTQIIRPNFTGASFTDAAIRLKAASRNTTIIPFIPSQVIAETGATVSTQTVQVGTTAATLTSGGGWTGTINWPIQYNSIPFVTLNITSASNPAGSLGTIQVKNGVGYSGVYVEIVGGPANANVVIEWRAGN